MRERAKSTRGRTERFNLDPGAIEYIDGLIAEDPELQKIKRRDIIRAVGDLGESLDRDKLSRRDVRNLMKKLKDEHKRDREKGAQLMLSDMVAEELKVLGDKPKTRAQSARDPLKPETRGERSMSWPVGSRKKLEDELKKKVQADPDLGMISDKLLDRVVKNVVRSGEKDIEVLFSMAAGKIFDEMGPETEGEGLAGKSGRGIKIFQPKQLVTRLPILMAQLKAGNNSKSLVNEIKQIAYSLLRSKHITKAIYNRILNSLKSYK